MEQFKQDQNTDFSSLVRKYTWTVLKFTWWNALEVYFFLVQESELRH